MKTSGNNIGGWSTGILAIVMLLAISCGDVPPPDTRKDIILYGEDGKEIRRWMAEEVRVVDRRAFFYIESQRIDVIGGIIVIEPHAQTTHQK